MHSHLTVLVINDDGPDSPFLAPFLSALRSAPWVGELRVVVPDSNRSWISGAVTRSTALAVRKVELCGISVTLVSGTPADCASLGIFNLFENPPDLVLSGPNLGRNTGLAYGAASGTLGGATLAGLSGIRALALSVKCPPVIQRLSEINLRDPQLAEHEEDWRRLSQVLVSVSERILKGDLFDRSRIVNVNVPWRASGGTPLVMTHVGECHYGRLFELQGDGTYLHSNAEIFFQGTSTHYTDEQCVIDEKISVTLYNPLLAGQALPAAEAEVLTARFLA